mmetsp:Transcript_6041/g.11979  ORF Transcript_6041/g.11979 Transcript_6041/m.11979 type:complete len:203 (+) Transcript_6041:814-1422(+)
MVRLQPRLHLGRTRLRRCDGARRRVHDPLCRHGGHQRSLSQAVPSARAGRLRSVRHRPHLQLAARSVGRHHRRLRYGAPVGRDRHRCARRRGVPRRLLHDAPVAHRRPARRIRGARRVRRVGRAGDGLVHCEAVQLRPARRLGLVQGVRRLRLGLVHGGHPRAALRHPGHLHLHRDCVGRHAVDHHVPSSQVCGHLPCLGGR